MRLTHPLALGDGPAAVWLGLCAVGVLVLLARSLRRRRAVRLLRDAAHRYARGDLSAPVRVDGPAELRDLAGALSSMAAQLASRLGDVVQQRNELGAVLSSMVEGVVAVDDEERVLSLNAAAGRLLGVDAGRAIDQPIQAVIRNSAVLALARQTRAERVPQAGEATLHPPADPSAGDDRPVSMQGRHVRVQTAPLRDDAGAQTGTLLVLHDVTRLRRLESVRRDFVANVSHEVRTPVAAIKAAVEALSHPDAPPDAATRERFLAIAERQADRLAAVVDDLLALARIEQERDTLADDLEPAPVRPVLERAVETCEATRTEATRAEAGTRVRLSGDAGVVVRMQPNLLEQAVVNLLDNALKYSPAGTEVRVGVVAAGGEAVIEVADQGRGIEPQHLPRVFERFYRTDASRHRGASDAGGTGLGLAIVKHIAEAHGGRVSVDSVPGRGSTFRIHLPRG